LDAESVYESLPVHQIFDGLVDIDGSLRIVPSLARTWTVSPDGLSYTFRLREGVRFHDGSPLTADDVVFTIRRLLSPEQGRRNVACAYLDVVQGAPDFSRGRRRDLPGVVAEDPLTIRLTLDRAYPSFFEVLAMDGLRIVPRGAVTRADRDFRRAPVGTGPFRVASWGRDELRLVANEDHFAGPPYLDAVVIGFLQSAEHDSGAGRFRAGDVDVLEAPATEVEALSRDPRVRLLRYPEMSLTFLGLDTTLPYLQDPKVRMAISRALDRGGLGSAVGAVYRPASGILPPGLAGYIPGTEALAHDPGLASRLLAEAGYPEGRGFPTLDVYATANSATAQAVFRGISRDLASVGIRARLRDVRWEEFTRRVDAREAPAFLLTWIADLTDPDAFLRTLFQSGAPANLFGFSDEQTDRLLAQGAQERDPAARGRIYARAEQRLLHLAPLVPLYHTVRVLALRPQVRGLEPGPLGLANVGLESVWIEREEKSS
jgi:ABC-type transport system substrate-binding protein